MGIQKAKGDYIIILNPDTLVDPNWIKELILAYEKIWGWFVSTQISYNH